MGSWLDSKTNIALYEKYEFLFDVHHQIPNDSLNFSGYKSMLVFNVFAIQSGVTYNDDDDKNQTKTNL